MKITVNNAVYVWDDARLGRSKSAESEYYLMVEGNPKVVNRRKHPRYSLKNPCRLQFASRDEVFEGQMVNISAGGFAFMTTSPEIA